MRQTVSTHSPHFNTFVAWEKTTNDTIDFKKVYFDITQDLYAALLLSQIVYWFLPQKDGSKASRAKVQRHHRRWIVKQRSDWWDEIRITERQYDRAIKILQAKKLVTIMVGKSPFHQFERAHYISLNFDILTHAINTVINNINKNDKKVSSSNINEHDDKVYSMDNIDDYDLEVHFNNIENKTKKVYNNTPSHQLVISTSNQSVISINTETIESKINEDKKPPVGNFSSENASHFRKENSVLEKPPKEAKGKAYKSKENLEFIENKIPAVKYQELNNFSEEMFTYENTTENATEDDLTKRLLEQLRDYCLNTFNQIDGAYILDFFLSLRDWESVQQLYDFVRFLVETYGADVVKENVDKLIKKRERGIYGYYTPSFVKEFFMRTAIQANLKHNFKQFCLDKFHDASVADRVYKFYYKTLRVRTNKNARYESVNERRKKNIEMLLEKLGIYKFLDMVEKFETRIKSGVIAQSDATLEYFTNFALYVHKNNGKFKNTSYQGAQQPMMMPEEIDYSKYIPGERSIVPVPILETSETERVSMYYWRNYTYTCECGEVVEPFNEQGKKVIRCPKCKVAFEWEYFLEREHSGFLNDVTSIIEA
ncbi:MAG TPA: hypothetical protein P5173_05470 [Bacilli bacterium]|nr:hypothetical protein [Bacilli bacterium]